MPFPDKDSDSIVDWLSSSDLNADADTDSDSHADTVEETGRMVSAEWDKHKEAESDKMGNKKMKLKQSLKWHRTQRVADSWYEETFDDSLKLSTEDEEVGGAPLEESGALSQESGALLEDRAALVEERNALLEERSDLLELIGSPKTDDGKPECPPMFQPCGHVPGLHVIGLPYTSNGKTRWVFEKSAAGQYFVTGGESGGRMKFTILGYKAGVHRRLELLDGEGKRIAMVERQIATAHDRCLGYRCDGKDDLNKEKAFDLHKPHAFGGRTDLRVSLESSSSRASGYRIIVDERDKTCTFYMGDGSGVIAQTYPPENGNKCIVEVYPNVDYAFVVLLVATVDAMGSSGKWKDYARRAFKCAAFFGSNVLFEEFFEVF